MQMSYPEKQQLVSIADSLRNGINLLMIMFISLPAFEFVIFAMKHEFTEFERAENVPIPDVQANAIVNANLKATISLDNHYIQDIPLLKWT
jgi:hypothetical protein